VDEIRVTFWESLRYLFPPHARAIQTGSGALVISWALQHDPRARFTHATPISIRFEDELIHAMRVADREERISIAKRHEGVVKAGLVGYDPYTAVPKARVIVLG
jgi:hypothetical protein